MLRKVPDKYYKRIMKNTKEAQRNQILQVPDTEDMRATDGGELLLSSAVLRGSCAVGGMMDSIEIA